MKIQNLLLLSTVLASTACSSIDHAPDFSFEQEPAPYTYLGGKYFHKNGVQRAASHNENYNERYQQSNGSVNYIDSNEDVSSIAIRSKPLAPVNSKYDERIQVSTTQHRARPVIDDSRAQQFASVDHSFVVKPKPVYERPVREADRNSSYREQNSRRAAPVIEEVAKDDGEYLDLSKVQSFETNSSSKFSSVKPMTKPAYSNTETAYVAPVKAAPRAVREERIVVQTPQIETKVKEVEVASIQPAQSEEVVIPPTLEKIVTPKPSISGARFIKPVDGQVIANFGDRSDGTFNDGINIAGSEGSPVKAAANGSVVYSGNQLQGYGNLLIIRHEDGYLTAYAHLKDLDLSKGEVVKQGDVIGKIGKSGNVESPQLHFGVRKGREPVDPKDFL